MPIIDYSTKFRTAQNKLRTQSLFKESNNAVSTSEEFILYTLSDRSGSYPCIVDLYVQEEDPTEYLFAEKYFESYTHWEMVRKAGWFQETYSKMRASLEAKLQSLAIQKMLEKVHDGSAGHQTLAYLASKGYIPKEEAGRPSKKRVQAELDKKTKEQQEFNDELARITEHNPKIRKLHE